MNDCDNYEHGILKGICTDTMHIHSVILNSLTSEHGRCYYNNYLTCNYGSCACIHENDMNGVTNKQTSLSHSNACQAQ